MLKYKLNLAMVLVWLIMGTSVGFGADDSFTPWGFDSRPVSTTPSHAMADSSACQKDISPSSRVVMGALNFFSEYISRVDGDRCPMYPTCASYSRKVIKKHGFFVGIVMTADRLIHEGNEMDYAPLVKTGKSVRYYDPVSWNDYWWYDRKENLDK
ncbi:MAG: membrane protein insertion efficiency factor YidD [Syntrophobacterales bacterium]|nr:membrane protein insertion efficiency factor YidD [Syntrophobacterales bacterium]